MNIKMFVINSKISLYEILEIWFFKIQNNSEISQTGKVDFLETGLNQFKIKNGLWKSSKSLNFNNFSKLKNKITS